MNCPRGMSRQPTSNRKIRPRSVGALASTVFLLVLPTAGFDFHSVAAAPTQEEDPKVEPIDAAVRFCGGHVSGASSADGSPGAHIIWDAYHSSLDRSEVVEHYLDLLGADDHEKKADCDTWLIPGDGTKRLVQVCDAEYRGGPWTECDPPPEDAKCILLLSTMIGGD